VASHVSMALNFLMFAFFHAFSQSAFYLVEKITKYGKDVYAD
jgi:hypothetical protein